MCWPWRQQLLFAIDQIRCVERCQFESMAVRDRVCRASFDAISAKNAAVVINVVNLGVALCATDAVFSSVLRRLDIYAIRRAVRRAEETGDALFQAILVTLQNVHTTKSLLNLCPAQRSGAIGIVLHSRRLEHLHERDGHPFGDCGYVLENRHTKLV